MGKSKGSKAARRRARNEASVINGALPVLAEVPRREGNGRVRRSATNRDPMTESLKARCRRWGLPRAMFREMRDPWWGCEAGGAMALAIAARNDRAALWDAICHTRRVVVAFDRAMGAPARHPQCLRLLLPVDSLSADASTPAPDDRTDIEREDDAVRELQSLQEWLGRAGAAAREEVERVVCDDRPCRNPQALVAALWHVWDGIRMNG
ncbi:MAG: hypothetical protein QM656_03365 [Paracoccaceae bacterium]